MMAIATLITSMAMAVPAHPGTTRVAQPDGTLLTIRLCGDEYLHFNTTADGYTIVQRPDGGYVYAQLNTDGQLSPTLRLAHDADKREAAELAWLHGMKRRLTPAMTPQMSLMRKKNIEARAQAQATHRAKAYDNFKGLILLVQFNDRSFSRTDIDSIINDMANKPGYTGYANNSAGRYTGSVHDYFVDNSMGQFAPEFDVVGPITINKSQYAAKGTEKAYELVYAAVNAADSLVNYSQYDSNGDGKVDLVYFIFAGLGSNVGGNDARLIWPHASVIYNPYGGYNNWEVRKDGVVLNDYACSTELTGNNASNMLEGIGTICHEFSHVLGVMDMYDTDYGDSGGQCPDPGEWSVMSGGSYLNNGRTPCGYTLYERYAMGFTTPQKLTEEGSYTLEPLELSNQGYMLETKVRKEFFLFENRQTTTKWDKYLPGHGMLVFRVDSTNANVWQSNKVNCNPNHMYFEMVRAKEPPSYSDASGQVYYQCTGSDPYPGTARVRELNNDTEPGNLKTWRGYESTFGLDNITENGGIINFNLITLNQLKRITLPQSIAIGKSLTYHIPAVFYPESALYEATWTSSDTNVATVNNKGGVTGVNTGETDITVTAVSNGETITATCHVIVEEQPIANSIADIKTMTEMPCAALLLNNALVVYINKTDVFLRDATGAIVLENTGLDLEVGDRLNGSLCGKVTTVNRISRLQPVEGYTNSLGYSVKKGMEVEPRQLSVADVSEADYGDLITLTQTPMVMNNGIWAVGGENKIRLYNTFKISTKIIQVPSQIEGKYFNVTGIYLTNKLNGEIIDELALTAKIEETTAPSGIGSVTSSGIAADTPATVFTTDGRKVAQTTVGRLASLPLRQGVYVVRTNNGSWRILK